MQKLNKLKPMSGCIPNEANAIEYRRKLGHHLLSHVDDRQLSKEPIANLSLAGDCFMTYCNVAPHRNTAVKERRLLLKRRCLQVLTGKARYEFSHAIENADLISERRVSVTMRESPLSAGERKLAIA
jgi:alkylated DNA repair dioxygenase AlkB